MSRTHLQEALSAQVPEFAHQVADTILKAGIESYALYTREQLQGLAVMGLASFLRDLTEDQNRHFATHWEKITEARAAQGARIEDLLLAIFLSEELLTSFVLERWSEDLQLQIWWLRRLHEIVRSGIGALARVFTMVRERVAREQDEQIRTLSTPVIPLHPGVLALPLVGTIDQHRAGQIMEALLSGIHDHKADVVLIDVTGVPVVDAEVANGLVQAARSARLLGANVVLVGISPEIAQTMTQIGVDISQLQTQANLQAGIAYALAQQGWRLVKN